MEKSSKNIDKKKLFVKYTIFIIICSVLAGFVAYKHFGIAGVVISTIALITSAILAIYL